MVDSYQIQPEPVGFYAPGAEPTEEEAQTTETTPETEAVVERPSGLPEQFKSVEDLAKSYQELQKKFTQESQSKAAETKQTETPVEKPTESESIPSEDSTESKPTESQDDAARQTLETKGLDFDKFTKSYSENGKLTDDDYSSLEKSGIPKTLVDEFIQGRMAIQERSVNSVYAEVGGADNYKQMVDWAAKNLSEAERTAYDSSVDSGDLNKAKLAARGLYSEFIKANGKEPQLIQGQASKGDGTAFRSSAEISTAMADPRYKTDAAYRDEVARKIDRSDALFRTS